VIGGLHQPIDMAESVVDRPWLMLYCFYPQPHLICGQTPSAPNSNGPTKDKLPHRFPASVFCSPYAPFYRCSPSLSYHKCLAVRWPTGMAVRQALLSPRMVYTLQPIIKPLAIDSPLASLTYPCHFGVRLRCHIDPLTIYVDYW